VGVTVTQPTTPSRNPQGLVGPFAFNWSQGSDPALIAVNGPVFFEITSNNAAMFVVENGVNTAVDMVSIGQQFWVEPSLTAGQQTISIDSVTDIVLSFEEEFSFDFCDVWYFVIFEIWQGIEFTVASEPPTTTASTSAPTSTTTTTTAQPPTSTTTTQPQSSTTTTAETATTTAPNTTAPTTTAPATTGTYNPTTNRARRTNHHHYYDYPHNHHSTNHNPTNNRNSHNNRTITTNHNTTKQRRR